MFLKSFKLTKNSKHFYSTYDPNMRKNILNFIHSLFEYKKDKKYQEDLSLVDHSLQVATLAEKNGSSSSFITACLLHDIGDFFMDEKDYLKDIFNNVNPKHEVIGSNFLENFFTKSVSEPVLLHVEAKRYLARDPNYYKNLSQASKDSLKVQGGILNEQEQSEFLKYEFAKDALELRKLDDLGKEIDLKTPDFHHFSKYVLENFK
eukprot:gene4906-8495_t